MPHPMGPERLRTRRAQEGTEEFPLWGDVFLIQKILVFVCDRVSFSMWLWLFGNSFLYMRLASDPKILLPPSAEIKGLHHQMGTELSIPWTFETSVLSPNSIPAH